MKKIQELRQALAAYQPDVLRPMVRQVLNHVRPDAVHSQARAPLDSFLAREVGGWFDGLSEEWDPQWCACHCLPGRTTVEICLDKVMDQLDAVHRYRVGLADLAETSIPVEASSFQAAMADLAMGVIDLVIEATGCNESWYWIAADAFEWVLEARGLALDEAAKTALEQTTERAFSSWTVPEDKNRSVVADDVALLAVKHAFGEQYGDP